MIKNPNKVHEQTIDLRYAKVIAKNLRYMSRQLIQGLIQKDI